MNGGQHEQGKPQERREGRPRLSVLLLSAGDDCTLERALSAVSDAVFALGAQLIIARKEASAAGRERVQRLAQQHRCAVAFVDAGCDRVAMSREALRLVTGDILAIRDASVVNDSSWLEGLARAHGLEANRDLDHQVTVTNVTVDERVVVGGRPVIRNPPSTRRRGEATSEPLA